jgi:hypothetical protein
MMSGKVHPKWSYFEFYNITSAIEEIEWFYGFSKIIPKL